MQRLALAGVFVLVSLLVVANATSAPSGASEKSWRITIENLTDGAPSTVGQPLSPPLVGVHTTAADMWSVGAPANEIIRYIAEDGDPFFGQPLFAAMPGVRSSTIMLAAGLPPEQQPIFPGQARATVVTTTQNVNRLSIAFMLGATNDGFTGLDALHLNGRGGVYYVNAYDAGTERNNEDAAFMGALGGLTSLYVRDPEHGVIAPHPGIRGDNDLDPAIWGWDDPVAKITIERL